MTNERERLTMDTFSGENKVWIFLGPIDKAHSSLILSLSSNISLLSVLMLSIYEDFFLLLVNNEFCYLLLVGFYVLINVSLLGRDCLDVIICWVSRWIYYFSFPI